LKTLAPFFVVWRANLIVFISSACTMVLELVAGRIMAPYIGVSLYTWTSIIGVVLAGISLGNYLGGKIADRFPANRTLGVLFFVASMATLGVLAASVMLDHLIILARIPLQWRIVALTAIMFFAPSAVLGTISPVVVKLALRDLASAGNLVGRIYAFGALGSIVGTFLTGFWLISLFGTRRIVFAVALLLLCMALACGGFLRSRHVPEQAAIVVGVLLAWFLDTPTIHFGVLGHTLVDFTESSLRLRSVLADLMGAVITFRLIWLGFQWRKGANPSALAPIYAMATCAVLFTGSWRWLASHGRFEAPCNRETNYYCIRVDEDRSSSNELLKRLVLDHLIHSYSSLEDPTALQYGYESVYAELTTFLVNQRADDVHALFIGGGGYTFPRYLEAKYPSSTIDVLEVDPGVTQTAYEQLGLRRGGRIHTTNGDARASLQAMQRNHQYNLIFGDAFNDLSVPYHLTTKEFDAMVHEAIGPEGFFMANIIDNYQQGQFVKAYMRALRVVFPYVYLMSNGSAWNSNAQNTYIVLATDTPFDYDTFAHVITLVSNKGPVSLRLNPARLDNDLATGPNIVLTDDYAPVDNLVAPLFAQRGF
jgi:spermidine synthase/MFS family permease